MKLTLTFKLPEEEAEYRMYKNGPKYLSVIEDLDEYLRGRLKYENLDDVTYHALESVRTKLKQLRDEANE